MIVSQSCPLCNSESKHHAIVTRHVFGDQDNKHAFFKCTSCDVNYMYPRLSPEQEAHFYNKEFEKFMSSRSGEAGGWLKVEEHIKANEETKNRRMKYLANSIKGKKRILEYGCSSGFMLAPMIALGHDCVGIEPSGIFRSYLNEKSIQTFGSHEEMMKSNEVKTFDLIMHFFVLEHISEPVSFLKNQLELLNKNGQIVFEIPNAADPLHTIYNIPEFEKFYWSIAHPWYFTEKSLDYLLKNVGCKYEIKRDQRYDLSNHMIWARDRKPGGMNRFSEKLGSDLDNRYKQSLIDTGYCDTLVAVLTKE